MRLTLQTRLLQTLNKIDSIIASDRVDEIMIPDTSSVLPYIRSFNQSRPFSQRCRTWRMLNPVISAISSKVKPAK